MRSGIKIHDLVIGLGKLAARDCQIVVHYRGFLNRGELVLDSAKYAQPARIELGKRDCVAGLRYGIEGMRVGGVREVVVSPHLAYGAEGLTGVVPPNSVLRFEVELFDVRDPGVVKADDYPPGKHLYFFSPGEAARNRPRCQFGLQEDGRCGVSLTIPVSGVTWRHARHQAMEKVLARNETLALFDNVMRIPLLHPKACLSNDALWADSSEKANSITRQSRTDLPCVTTGVLERGVWHCYYSLPETSAVFRESKVFFVIAEMVRPFFLL